MCRPSAVTRTTSHLSQPPPPPSFAIRFRRSCVTCHIPADPCRAPANSPAERSSGPQSIPLHPILTQPSQTRQPAGRLTQPRVLSLRPTPAYPQLPRAPTRRGSHSAMDTWTVPPVATYAWLASTGDSRTSSGVFANTPPTSGTRPMHCQQHPPPLRSGVFFDKCWGAPRASPVSSKGHPNHAPRRCPRVRTPD